MADHRNPVPDELDVPRTLHEPVRLSAAGATALNAVGVALILATAPVVLVFWFMAAWSGCSYTTAGMGKPLEVIGSGLVWAAIPTLCGVVAKLGGRPWGNWAFVAVLIGGSTAYMAQSLSC